MAYYGKSSRGRIMPFRPLHAKRKQTGRCPKCGSFTYSTGRMKRVPMELTACASTRLIGGEKKYKYENEHRCSGCGGEFGKSQLQPL